MATVNVHCPRCNSDEVYRHGCSYSRRAPRKFTKKPSTPSLKSSYFTDWKHHLHIIEIN
ncbi:TPA: hypothetical protein JLM44_004684 [Escherichia coli]|nr:hypothetical protein [Escherichia coli]HAW3476816.1 hypothetical protein [Escherichia coli]HAW3744098.1 hypothetical protein [Escherichia coli]HCU1329123.1 hypothetical protein [Escherichia coli]